MNKVTLVHQLDKKIMQSLGLTGSLVNEIDEIPSENFLRMPQFKNALIDTFSHHGFVKRISLDPEHQLFITGKKDKIGLCIQMGHKAGFYFDLFRNN